MHVAVRRPENGPVETLVLDLDPGVEADRTFQDTVRSIGATVAHALDRGALLHAERAAAQAERDFSQALQTSLLSQPHVVDGVEIEVRYYAAVETSKIGGDWYDSFMVPDGSLLLVIGDIAGHDREAAIAMAQTRSMLRGIAFCSGSPPAAMMQRLDAAVTGLDIGTCSSAILARLDTDLSHHDGRRTLRWINAGHPPPFLITPDGEVDLLERPADPLLGVGPARERDDYAVELLPGSTLVLYTDGLVERRGEHLDVGIDRARGALRGAQDLCLEEIFDALSDVMGPSPDDDVAVLVLRVARPGS